MEIHDCGFALLKPYVPLQKYGLFLSEQIICGLILRDALQCDSKNNASPYGGEAYSLILNTYK